MTHREPGDCLRLVPILHKLPTQREVADGLKAEVRELTEQLRLLHVEQEELRFKHALVVGICLASKLAAGFLAQPPACHGNEGRTSCSLPEGLFPDLKLECQDLEAAEARLLEDWAPPAGPQPGSTRGLLACYFNNSQASQSVDQAYLGGGPLSMLHVTLLCLLYDPDHRARTLDRTSRPPAPGSFYTISSSELGELYEALEAAASGASSSCGNGSDPDPLRRAADALMVHLFVPGHSFHLLRPVECAAATKAIAPGELVPPALMQQLLEQLHISAEQLAAIMRGPAVVHKLAGPLAAKKAAALAQLSQLLGTTGEAAGLQGSAALAGPRGTAEGLGGLPVRDSSSSYHQQLRLMEQAMAAENQSTWLDICCGWYMLGQLSLQQQARLMLGLRPYPPLYVYFMRWLAGRAGLALMTSIRPCFVGPPIGQTPVAGTTAAAWVAWRQDLSQVQQQQLRSQQQDCEHQGQQQQQQSQQQDHEQQGQQHRAHQQQLGEWIDPRHFQQQQQQARQGGGLMAQAHDSQKERAARLELLGMMVQQLQSHWQ